MPTFIDESGDTGTKKGASACFRLAAVVFSTVADAEDYSGRLVALRVKLRLPETFEFHFSKTGHRLNLQLRRFVAFATLVALLLHTVFGRSAGVVNEKWVIFSTFPYPKCASQHADCRIKINASYSPRLGCIDWPGIDNSKRVW
jgi:hypothetical protein